MSFLNPALLFALPAVLLPLIIHLLNRRRFRKKDWGPMMFLREAMREKRGHRRLRQWLVLACRILAVAVLVLAVSRPLVGGWLAGWVGSGDQPVLIVLDRSASMEMRLAGQVTSKRTLAIESLIQECRRVRPTPLALIDSATMQVRELKTPAELSELTATDTHADWPALILAALRAWQESRQGRGELWLASDLQTSDWRPDDPQWAEANALYRQLPNPPTLRLLTLRGGQANLTLTCEPSQVANTLEINITQTDSPSAAEEVPLTWLMDGNRHVQRISLTGAQTIASLTIPQASETSIQTGTISLPDDGNNQDNQAHFALDRNTDVINVVVSDDPAMGRLLQLACSPWRSDDRSIKTVWRRHGDLSAIDWRKVALVIWQGGETPSPSLQHDLKTLAERGGQLLLFPDAGDNRKPILENARFGSTQESSSTGDPMSVATWARSHGPLADTSDGQPLPLDRLRVNRWATLEANSTALASITADQPLIQVMSLGEGQVHACGTLPTPSWSNLGEGLVLLPMVQRLVRMGAQSLARVDVRVCQNADSLLAGVYQENGQTVVLQRPVAEDESGELSEKALQTLFEGIPVKTFDLAASRSTEGLASEWWRPFLVIMLLLLATESILTLPPIRLSSMS